MSVYFPTDICHVIAGFLSEKRDIDNLRLVSVSASGIVYPNRKIHYVNDDNIAVTPYYSSVDNMVWRCGIFLSANIKELDIHIDWVPVSIINQMTKIETLKMSGPLTTGDDMIHLPCLKKFVYRGKCVASVRTMVKMHPVLTHFAISGSYKIVAGDMDNIEVLYVGGLLIMSSIPKKLRVLVVGQQLFIPIKGQRLMPDDDHPLRTFIGKINNCMMSLQSLKEIIAPESLLEHIVLYMPKLERIIVKFPLMPNSISHEPAECYAYDPSTKTVRKNNMIVKSPDWFDINTYMNVDKILMM